jgi:UDP-N-acetylglucosamine--N-acetylmuramyl-(pentapeptide) pyrophosphoryl-undecaprenol N-acetylglucosamine transferase
MRAYFGVCGVGLGHVGRCIPVAKKLRSMGNQILFSTYLEACDFVKREQFPLCNAPPISFAIRPDGGVDFQRTTVYPGIFSIAIFLRQLNAEIEFMRSFQPDFVISDSRVSTLVAAKILDIPSVTIP